MKKDVICPICEEILGRFHSNASMSPLRDHLFYSHKKEYLKILKTVKKIETLYDDLKKYGVNHWNMYIFHGNVEFEKQLEDSPPMSEEKRKELVAKIMKQE